MVAEGTTQRETSKYLGFKDKSVVNFALMSARKYETIISKFRCLKSTKTLQEYKYENKRPKMENELLQDYLPLIERMCGVFCRKCMHNKDE